MLKDPDQFATVKDVPKTLEARALVWDAAQVYLGGLSRKRPLDRMELLRAAKAVLSTARLEEACLGYAMVMLNNAFWLEQFAAVPIARRLLLLPRCLAALDAVRTRALTLGYRLHVADGSPIVVKIIAEEKMDAILGVGCLDSLEKAFDKVRQVGIPAIALPLNANGCKDTATDEQFLLYLLETTRPPAAQTTRNYLPLLRLTRTVFAPEQCEAFLNACAPAEEQTARLARHWLQLGGKRLRPFLTLASYKVSSGTPEIPPAVMKAALAIEALHKASLIHDDIEDDDQTRYGEKTIHRQYGIPAAINVGDYLLGLGYHLAVAAALELRPAAAGELARVLSDAHLRLARGQGLELLPDPERRALPDLEQVLNCYALKTAPAFEAALATGLLLSGAYEKYAGVARLFCRYAGVAFQIQNDFDGWASDVTHARSTALLALAGERCRPEERADLLRPAEPDAVRALYERTEAFARGRVLVERLRQRAVKLAQAEAPEELGHLLHFLADTVIQ